MTTTDLRPRRYDDEDDYDRRPERLSDQELAQERDEEENARAEPRPESSAPEREVTGELVQGELAGRPIYVPPVKQWRASALHALREGDFETWAKITLDDDDWAIWAEVDPTFEEIDDFFATVNTGIGTSPGNSRASRRSSRNTRRR